LAEGTKRASEKLRQGSEHFAMHVKGLELPAYDPRAAKITGLGYVTANRGGDHITAYVQGPTFIDTPFLVVEDSKIEDPLVANRKEAKVVVDLENALTMFDSIGACKFMGILLPAEDYVDLIATATGWRFGVDDFRECGERIFNLMRVFCVREGITRKADSLPKRLMGDPLPDGPAKGMVIEKTFAIVKPEAVARGAAGEIIARIEHSGFRIRAIKLIRASPTHAEKLYEMHVGKSFYQELLNHITSAPILPMVLEGEDSIHRLRALAGATNPSQAGPGTIRKDFGLSITKNAVHAADSPGS